MFVDRFVEEVGEDRCEERCDFLEDGWFDLVNVTRFVGVDFVHCFGDICCCNGLQFERRGFVVISAEPMGGDEPFQEAAPIPIADPLHR